jgi:hypothetical protein
MTEEKAKRGAVKASTDAEHSTGLNCTTNKEKKKGKHYGGKGSTVLECPEWSMKGTLKRRAATMGGERESSIVRGSGQSSRVPRVAR